MSYEFAFKYPVHRLVRADTLVPNGSRCATPAGRCPFWLGETPAHGMCDYLPRGSQRPGVEDFNKVCGIRADDDYYASVLPSQ